MAAENLEKYLGAADLNLEIPNDIYVEVEDSTPYVLKCASFQARNSLHSYLKSLYQEYFDTVTCCGASKSMPCSYFAFFKRESFFQRGAPFTTLIRDTLKSQIKQAEISAGSVSAFNQKNSLLFILLPTSCKCQQAQALQQQQPQVEQVPNLFGSEGVSFVHKNTFYVRESGLIYKITENNTADPCEIVQELAVSNFVEIRLIRHIVNTLKLKFSSDVRTDVVRSVKDFGLMPVTQPPKDDNQSKLRRLKVFCNRGRIYVILESPTRTFEHSFESDTNSIKQEEVGLETLFESKMSIQ